MSEQQPSTILDADTPPARPLPRDQLREYFRGPQFAQIRARLERWPWLWPYGGLIALIFLVTLKAWFSTHTLIIGGDAVLIHYPWFEFWRDEIGAGRFPYWNPYTFGGFPAFATPQSGFAYPPHWLVTWMPSAMAMNWMIGLHIMLAGVSTAWCARKLGAEKDGQFLAGAVFALGSAVTARTLAGHFSFIEAVAWLPLATGLAVSINERHRPWQLALVMGMMALAAQPDIVIFSAWWLPLWALGVHVSKGRRATGIALGRTAVGMVLGLGVAAFFLIPVTELQDISNRAIGLSWDFRTGGSLPFWHLLEVVNPTVFGKPEASSYWPGPAYEWHERLLYIGVISLLVAAFARGKVAWVCWIAVAAALALAFGRYVPWYTLTTSLPGYEYFRIPGRHVELAALGLALAAGVGLHRMPARTVSIAAVASAVVLFILSISASVWLDPFVSLLGGSDNSALKGVDLGLFANRASGPLGVAAILLAGVALLALLPSTWFRRGVVLLAVLEVIFVLQPYRFSSGHPEDVYRSAESSLPEGSRRAVVQDGALIANYGPVLKSVQPGGYTSLFSASYMELVTGQRNPGVVINASASDTQILYLLGYDSIFNPEAKSISVFEPKPARAWVAHCARPGGAAEVRANGFPMFSCVTTNEGGAETDVPSSPATIVSEHAGFLKITAEGPGHLFTGTPLYPGWSARVDGKKTPVEAVDGAILGVELPEGTHEVVLSYHPAGLTLGSVLTALSLAVLAGIWYWERRAGKTAEAAGSAPEA